MARLIDADALNADFIQNHTANTDVYLTVRKIIDNAPTVDAVEVVRCKDCEYCSESESLYRPLYLRCDHPNMEYDTECLDMWVEVEADDFCSYGKRKVSE